MLYGRDLNITLNIEVMPHHHEIISGDEKVDATQTIEALRIVAKTHYKIGIDSYDFISGLLRNMKEDDNGKG